MLAVTIPDLVAAQASSAAGPEPTLRGVAVSHAGVFLTNPEPAKFHVHTIVRTPNGNDYGKDLLRQHYERHPHPHKH